MTRRVLKMEGMRDLEENAALSVEDKPRLLTLLDLASVLVLRGRSKVNVFRVLRDW